MLPKFKNHTFIGIAHTPFHLFYLKIIESKVKCKDFIILSTLNSKDHSTSIIQIKNNIPSLILIKRWLHRAKELESVILVPHLNGFLSNIFYNGLQKNSKTIFIMFYEGIALFRDEKFDTKLSTSKEIGRIFLSICLNLGYRKVGQAPNFFRNSAICISPLKNDYLIKSFREVIEIPFLQKQKSNTANDLKRLIYVCHKNNNSETIQKLINALQIKLNFQFSEIIVKPHLETDLDNLKSISNHYFIDNGNNPIEDMNIKENDYFLFSHFSSAIPNLNLLGVKKDKLFLYDKNLPAINLELSKYYTKL